MDDERFVTLFFGRIDPQTHELSYCNAGHEQPLLFAADGKLTRLATTGIALGVLETAIYKQESVKMSPGDLLVIFSDGVPDATNKSNEMFGTERFESVIREHRDESAAALTESITKAVTEFVGNAPQFDDLTLVVVKRNP